MMLWLGRLWAAVLLYLRVRRNVREVLETVEHRNGVRIPIPPPLPALANIPPAGLPEPMVVGVDWSHGCDIAVYRCGACEWETSIVEELLKHMKAHGATRLTVLPVTRPPAYKFGDRR